MRLNGWQRIGLVLSTLWILGASIYERKKQVSAADELFQFKFRLCLEEYPGSSCIESVSLQAAMDATANWPDVAFYAFGPVVAGWFVAIVTIKTFHWVADGFSKNFDRP